MEENSGNGSLHFPSTKVSDDPNPNKSEPIQAATTSTTTSTNLAPTFTVGSSGSTSTSRNKKKVVAGQQSSTVSGGVSSFPASVQILSLPQQQQQQQQPILAAATTTAVAIAQNINGQRKIQVRISNNTGTASTQTSGQQQAQSSTTTQQQQPTPQLNSKALNTLGVTNIKVKKSTINASAGNNSIAGVSTSMGNNNLMMTPDQAAAYLKKTLADHQGWLQSNISNLSSSSIGNSITFTTNSNGQQQPSFQPITMTFGTSNSSSTTSIKATGDLSTSANIKTTAKQVATAAAVAAAKAVSSHNTNINSSGATTSSTNGSLSFPSQQRLASKRGINSSSSRSGATPSSKQQAIAESLRRRIRLASSSILSTIENNTTTSGNNMSSAASRMLSPDEEWASAFPPKTTKRTTTTTRTNPSLLGRRGSNSSNNNNNNDGLPCSEKEMKALMSMFVEIMGLQMNTDRLNKAPTSCNGSTNSTSKNSSSNSQKKNDGPVVESKSAKMDTNGTLEVTTTSGKNNFTGHHPPTPPHESSKLFHFPHDIPPPPGGWPEGLLWPSDGHNDEEDDDDEIKNQDDNDSCESDSSDSLPGLEDIPIDERTGRMILSPTTKTEEEVNNSSYNTSTTRGKGSTTTAQTTTTSTTNTNTASSTTSSWFPFRFKYYDTEESNTNTMPASTTTTTEDISNVAKDVKGENDNDEAEDDDYEEEEEEQVTGREGITPFEWEALERVAMEEALEQEERTRNPARHARGTSTTPPLTAAASTSTSNASAAAPPPTTTANNNSKSSKQSPQLTNSNDNNNNNKKTQANAKKLAEDLLQQQKDTAMRLEREEKKRDKLIQSWRNRITTACQANEVSRLEQLLSESPLNEDRDIVTEFINNNATSSHQMETFKSHLNALAACCIAKNRQQQTTKGKDARLLLTTYILCMYAASLLAPLPQIGRSVLHTACFWGDVEMVRRIILYLADGELKSNNASNSSKPKQCETHRRLKSLIVMDAKCQDSGWTPFHYAVLSGSFETMEILLWHSNGDCASVRTTDTNTWNKVTGKGLTARELVVAVLTSDKQIETHGMALQEAIQHLSLSNNSSNNAAERARSIAILESVVERLTSVEENGYSHWDHGRLAEVEKKIEAAAKQQQESALCESIGSDESSRVKNNTGGGGKKKKKKKKAGTNGSGNPPVQGGAQNADESSKARDVVQEDKQKEDEKNPGGVKSIATNLGETSSSASKDPLVVALQGMGFTEDQIEMGIKACGGLERATADDVVVRILNQDQPAEPNPNEEGTNKDEGQGANKDSAQNLAAEPDEESRKKQEQESAAAERLAAKREERRRRNREWNNRAQERQRQEAQARISQAAEIKARANQQVPQPAVRNGYAPANAGSDFYCVPTSNGFHPNAPLQQSALSGSTWRQQGNGAPSNRTVDFDENIYIYETSTVASSLDHMSSDFGNDDGTVSTSGSFPQSLRGSKAAPAASRSAGPAFTGQAMQQHGTMLAASAVAPPAPPPPGFGLSPGVFTENARSSFAPGAPVSQAQLNGLPPGSLQQLFTDGSGLPPHGLPETSGLLDPHLLQPTPQMAPPPRLNSAIDRGGQFHSTRPVIHAAAPAPNVSTAITGSLAGTALAPSFVPSSVKSKGFGSSLGNASIQSSRHHQMQDTSSFVQQDLSVQVGLGLNANAGMLDETPVLDSAIIDSLSTGTGLLGVTSNLWGSGDHNDLTDSGVDSSFLWGSAIASNQGQSHVPLGGGLFHTRASGNQVTSGSVGNTASWGDDSNRKTTIPGSSIW